MTVVTFLRFFDVLGFAKKTKQNTYRVTKTQKCHKFQNCDIVSFGNVTKCHTFSNLGTKLRLPFMFGLGSERLSLFILLTYRGGNIHARHQLMYTGNQIRSVRGGDQDYCTRFEKCYLSVAMKSNFSHHRVLSRAVNLGIFSAQS